MTHIEVTCRRLTINYVICKVMPSPRPAPQRNYETSSHARGKNAICDPILGPRTRGTRARFRSFLAEAPVPSRCFPDFTLCNATHSLSFIIVSHIGRYAKTHSCLNSSIRKARARVSRVKKRKETMSLVVDHGSYSRWRGIRGTRATSDTAPLTNRNANG